MKRFLKKLVLGIESEHRPPSANPINKAFDNVISIWNNKNHNDIGIEKLLRLFLAVAHLLFPGIYIRALFGKNSIIYQELIVDLFVILKLLLPTLLLYTGNADIVWLRYLVIWFLLETLLYIPMLIFASDLMERPRSYRRSMILLFVNYLEIVADFAVIYAAGNYLNISFQHWYDPIYFSFSTFSTVGFGDFYPITGLGKFFVCCQTIIFFLFVVLFINFYSNKLEQRGYFDRENKA